MNEKVVLARRAVPCAMATLLSAALPMVPTARRVSAAPTRSDEVRSVLANVDWESAPPFTRGDFRRLDESEDAQFYSEPRFVYHIDDAAVKATTKFYGRFMDETALVRYSDAAHPLDVLDLCSSWVCHYPQRQLQRVSGLGMNAAELARNPQLSDWTVRDLNKSPTLPYADGSFDAVTMTVSIDYLTAPLQVMREAARVLRPGGAIAIVFSNRLFLSKAVALWTGKDDLEHVYTVGEYVHYGAGVAFTDPEAIDLTPVAGGFGRRSGDPLYAVVARRTERPIVEV